MAEPSSPPRPDSGLLASVKGLIATAIGAAETRLAIFGTELEEERLRLLTLIFWGALFLFVLFLGSVLLAILMVVVFWDTQRVLVLGVLTGLFLGAALVIGLGLRAWMRSAPRPFRVTVGELAKDRERIGS
ncbi:MAG: phage holin family protein [Pseudomonadota bacterium]